MDHFPVHMSDGDKIAVHKASRSSRLPVHSGACSAWVLEPDELLQNAGSGHQFSAYVFIKSASAFKVVQQNLGIFTAHMPRCQTRQSLNQADCRLRCE